MKPWRFIVVALAWAAPALALAAMSDDDKAAILAPTADFARAERWESLPGGTATNRARFDREAFSQPSANLSFEEKADFAVGNGLFRRIWVSAPASTRSADGLGPLYNARACQRCHLKDGRGHPPAGPDDSAVSMFLRLSVPPQSEADKARLAARRAAVIAEPTYGEQLQDLAIAGHAPEGRMTIDYREIPVALAGGEVASLRKPTYDIVDLGYGALHPEVMVSPRVAPQMIGMGLLEAVAADDILAGADPDDADGDGVSGRPNRVWDSVTGGVGLGRFGWKAGKASLAEQNATALAGDIGVSNPLASDPWGDCTASQRLCRAGPHGVGGDSGTGESDAGDSEDGRLEATAEVMDLILFYARNLAVPARRDVDRPEVLRGKALFYRAGCAGCTGCHRPKFATRADYDEPALAGQLIWPYSDLLLHDMGEGLADHRPEGEASGREWRTAPLWGIALTETVSGHSYFLHDGRARNLAEAILWHGGEAEMARDAFAAMPKGDRDALLAFLGSL
ncbi:MAG: di-heme oxidoredictase family protein [Kiloniellales bacterium]|nr:di-heme oxidoredictase family protein [Kiloniellales bacterium]